MEMEDYKNAIMVFKALKNLCKKWQMDEIYLLKHHGQGSFLMSNTKKFVPHIMALYNQIGYLYRNIKFCNAAVDYFKKQLIIAWQNDDLNNELLAYEQLSITNYYLGEEDNIERAL